MSGTDQELSLESFYVYNPSFGNTEETEHEKVLFFHPSTASSNDQQSAIGLSEAFVNFSRTFSPKRPCEIVHTEKRVMAFAEPEPDFWMVMCVRYPLYCSSSESAMDSSSESGANAPKTSVGAAAKTTVRSDTTAIDDSLLKSLLEQWYRYFRLFCGSMKSILQAHGRDVLKKKLEWAFLHFLTSLDLKRYSLYDGLDGIHYLPLDRTLFVRCQTSISRMQQQFPNIAHVIMLAFDHVVWSSLNQENTRAMYRHWIRVLPSQRTQHESLMSASASSPALSSLFQSPGSNSSCLNDTSASSASASSFLTSPQYSLAMDSQVGYIVGPRPSLEKLQRMSLDDSGILEEAEFSTDCVYPSGTLEEEYRLVIYQLHGLTVILFVSSGYPLRMRFFTALKSYMHDNLDDLSRMISMYYTRSALVSSVGASSSVAPGVSQGSADKSAMSPMRSGRSASVMQQSPSLSQSQSPAASFTSASAAAAAAGSGPSLSSSAAATRDIAVGGIVSGSSNDILSSPGLPLMNEDEFKYIYFNHMNLAIKTSVKRRSAIPSEVMQRMGILHGYLATSEQPAEIIDHSKSGFWILAKKASDREIVIVVEKSSNIGDIYEEMRKFGSRLFQHVFMPFPA
eukprot:ANDGO_08554.mRNA.1 Vacuolar fusion protein CCZ1 homolog